MGCYCTIAKYFTTGGCRVVDYAKGYSNGSSQENLNGVCAFVRVHPTWRYWANIEPRPARELLRLTLCDCLCGYESCLQRVVPTRRYDGREKPKANELLFQCGWEWSYGGQYADSWNGDTGNIDVFMWIIRLRRKCSKTRQNAAASKIITAVYKGCTGQTGLLAGRSVLARRGCTVQSRWRSCRRGHNQHPRAPGSCTARRPGGRS